MHITFVLEPTKHRFLCRNVSQFKNVHAQWNTNYLRNLRIQLRKTPLGILAEMEEWKEQMAEERTKRGALKVRCEPSPDPQSGWNKLRQHFRQQLNQIVPIVNLAELTTMTWPNHSSSHNSNSMFFRDSDAYVLKSIAEYVLMGEKKAGMAIDGANGVGKTQLLAAIATMSMAANFPVTYIVCWRPLSKRIAMLRL